MPRQARIELPDSLHHIMARGANGQDIFLDKKDFVQFRDRLGELMSQSSNQCYAWALLNNHFHLLLKSGDEPLSKMMRRLLTGHAVYFNRRHKRSGHLFQNRFKSVLCQEDLYFLQLVRYIHLNPIRAGVVKTMKTLNKYPFSGHASIIGEQTNDWQDVRYTLSWFGKQVKKSKENYLEYVKDGIKEGKRNDLTGGGLLRTVGGWKNLKELKKRGRSVLGDERMLGDSDFVASMLKHSVNENEAEQIDESDTVPISLEQLTDEVCSFFNVKPADLCSASKHRGVLKAKACFCYTAVRILGCKGNEVSAYLNLNKSTVSRMVSGFKLQTVLEKFLKKHTITVVKSQ